MDADETLSLLENADEPPAKAPHPDTARDYLRDRIRRGVLGALLESHIRSVLREFDRLRGELNRLQELETSRVTYTRESVTPDPGLHYVDPGGRFGCQPANPTFEDHASTLSTLELRVLAAHLSTALDSVTTALKKRREP